jgi:hypothetical protein
MYGEPVHHTATSTALVGKQTGWAFFKMEQDRAGEPTPLLTVEARGGQVCLVDGQRAVRFSIAVRRQGPTGVVEWLYVDSIRPNEPGPGDSFSGGRPRDFVGTGRTSPAGSPTVTFTVRPLDLLRAAHGQREWVTI